MVSHKRLYISNSKSRIFQRCFDVASEVLSNQRDEVGFFHQQVQNLSPAAKQFTAYESMEPSFLYGLRFNPPVPTEPDQFFFSYDLTIDRGPFIQLVYTLG